MEAFECRSYTSVRRFPRVVGNFQGFQLPIPMTMPQLGATGATFLLLLVTRGTWAHLSLVGNAAVMAVLPMIVGRLAKRPQVEGRGAIQFAAGALSYFVSRIGIRFRSPNRAVHVRTRIAFEEFCR